mgnify:CR=1 FL=1
MEGSGIISLIDAIPIDFILLSGIGYIIYKVRKGK